MSANRFGKFFSLTSFGESHGPALGAVIEGCPAGIPVDEKLLQTWLDRRRPGQSAITTSRQEPDQAEILSGVYQGKTLGTPIVVVIRNQDARSQDYTQLITRPGHADDVWREKFGHSDPRGGGRSSGRETLTRVIGAAFAQMFLHTQVPELKIQAFTSAIGPLRIAPQELQTLSEKIDLVNAVESSMVRCPSLKLSEKMQELLAQAKTEGKSYGGSIHVQVSACPKGLGQPVFHKLKADLAAAYFSIGATAAVEIGDGAEAATQEGSQFHLQKDQSQYGGIRGGISTGEQIAATIHFKPTASVLDVAKQGRHDPCIVPRAVPVVEAMTTLVIADHLLWQRLDKK